MQPGKINVVESAVVLCVLGLVGALTIPRFTRADVAPGDDAERRAQLRLLRLAIERYRQDHRCYPGQMGDGASPGGSPAAFISQLTSATDANGIVGPATNMRFCYGPYLRDGLPGGTEAGVLVRVIRRGDPLAPDESSPARFVYNCDTGQIIANTAIDGELP